MDTPAAMQAPLAAVEEFRRTVLANPWITHKPHPKQALFLLHSETREILFGGAVGGGKALCTQTRIPTPVGWKLLADIVPGDEVFGVDGLPTLVTHVSEIMFDHPCWRVVFDDGAEIIADAEHRWLTFDLKELTALTRRLPEWRARRREKRASRVSGRRSPLFTLAVTARNKRLPPAALELPCGSIRTTEQIAATVWTKRGVTNHAVPVASRIELPEVSLPLDPYVLGVWLGDGTSRSAGLTCADDELVDAVRATGWAVKRYGRDRYSWLIGAPVKGICRNGRRGLVNPFAVILREIGVLGNKHVPAIYLRSSSAQRLALLQGLMDTDGTVAKNSGCAEFVSTNKRLAEAVVELACSLGHKAWLREGRAKLRGRDCGPKWTVKWLPLEKVFRLSRKANLQKIATRRTTKFRYIVKCELVKSVPVKCIKVAAADGLFLAGEHMIPTHNTDALLMAALQYVETPGYAALVLMKTYRDLSLPKAGMSRMREWLSGTAAKCRDGGALWEFPSGAVIQFGYMDVTGDEQRYRTAEFQYIGLDELTRFPEEQYRFLFSRLRRLKGVRVPLRVRSGTNPGGVGHAWVRKRFVPPAYLRAGMERFSRPWWQGKRLFIPARLEDNPSLDMADYEASLAELPQAIRQQLRMGDWSDVKGEHFSPADWPRYDTLADGWSTRTVYGRVAHLREEVLIFITVDWATSASKYSDQTAMGVFGLLPDGRLLVLDMVAEHIALDKCVERLARLCRQWHPDLVAVEANGFQAALANECRRYSEIPEPRRLLPEGSKMKRAIPAIVMGENGRVLLPVFEPAWADLFASELSAFTGNGTELDDQVDVLAYAAQLATQLRGAHTTRVQDPEVLTPGWGAW